MHNNNITVEVRCGMYGLPQTGILANQQLRTLLSKHRYNQCPTIHSMFCHATRDISFTLIVEDFGIKYTDTADLNHLMAAVRETYVATIDTSGTLYCGLILKWDYITKQVDISMSGYVNQTIQSYSSQPFPHCPQHSPRPWKNPNYGAK